MSAPKLMSQNSVEQDENLAKLYCKTPGTPMKIVHQTPRKSNRKRSLFQTNSPNNSDDLGPISPLSASSNNSFQSNCSPYFSPNGKFTTPSKALNDTSPKEMKEKFYNRKIEVKSSLFPNLNVHTPKSQRKFNTPVRQSPKISTGKKRKTEKRAVAKDLLTDMITPTRSSRRTRRDSSDNDEVESNSLSNPCSSDTSLNSTLGIKTISSESFYGPAPAMPKHRTQLFIDSLGSKLDGKKRTRSLSKESLISNRSFVSGAAQHKKKKTTDTFGRLKNMKHGHQKGPHIGVWHGIKKPKKMKPIKNTKTSLLSPNCRISKMVDTLKSKPIQGKTKRPFEEKSRRKIASTKKKNFGLSSKNEIIDSFPHHLVKRKLLPTAAHPSSDMATFSGTPDPKKKFLKYGLGRKATFTLNENLKIQYSDGVMKLQSPKKRRKLYSGKNEIFFDFNDDDPKSASFKKNIENILIQLDDDKSIQNSQKEHPKIPSKMIENISTEQILKFLECPSKKVNSTNESENKVLGEIQNGPKSKLSTNLTSLAMNELQENDASRKDVNGEIKLEKDEDKKEYDLMKNETTSLQKNDFEQSHFKQEIKSYKIENEESSQGKFYSLFYKQNWNTSFISKENENIKTTPKKKVMIIPDDQYLLDAGQKSIGIVTCGKCGVMYQAGDFADEATHKNFHNHLPELRFTSWVNERVVGKYLDGRVIMIVSSDPKSWWYKIRNIVDIVDQELGFPEGSVNALFSKTVYLFVNEKAKQVVGCLIAEECKEAYKMFPPIEGIDVESCSKDPSVCKVGISRIWTALNHRRQGIAKRMIECLQRTFIFGEIVPMDLIAFSVPSPSGKLFAQKVTGKLDFLVYGFP